MKHAGRNETHREGEGKAVVSHGMTYSGGSAKMK